MATHTQFKLETATVQLRHTITQWKCRIKVFAQQWTTRECVGAGDEDVVEETAVEVTARTEVDDSVGITRTMQDLDPKTRDTQTQTIGKTITRKTLRRKIERHQFASQRPLVV